jgi:hypothetical protein
VEIEQVGDSKEMMIHSGMVVRVLSLKSLSLATLIITHLSRIVHPNLAAVF